MSFLAPSWLWLLFAIAALVGVYVLLQTRRRHYAVRFTNLDLLSSVAPRRPGWRRHVAAAAVAVGLTSLVVALARPVRDERVARDEATIMLVVDVSASMESSDVAPTRIQAASQAAQDFIAEVPASFKVGLIAYDRTARVLASPTTDRAELLGALAGLTTGPGTATGDAIDVALQTIAASTTTDSPATTTTPASTTTVDPAANEAPSATIVLLSDGKSTVGQSIDSAIQEATDAGVPVTTIAYGTPDGTVTVQGQTVAVPADAATMQQIAQATGGSSFTAARANELRSVYSTIQERVGYITEPREILRVFLGFGVVALIIGAAASLMWSGRFL